MRRIQCNKGARIEREIAMTHEAACLWCGGPFEPRRTGGTSQLFCTIAHRRAFDRAARSWVRQAIETGALTIADLQRASRTARALLGQPSDASAAIRVELGTAARRAVK